MAVLVAAMMVMAMCVPAWAATTTGRYSEDTGSITIKNSISGETYNAYRILTLASFSDDSSKLDNTLPVTGLHKTDAYAYLVEASNATYSWYQFVKTATGLDGTTLLFKVYDSAGEAVELKNVSGTSLGTFYVVTPNPSSTEFDNQFHDAPTESVVDERAIDEWTTDASVAQKFAREAVKYAKDHNLSVNGNTSGNGGDATIGSLPLGYYVVDSTVGSLCALDTTNVTVQINEKNAAPAMTKLARDNQIQAETPDLTTGFVTLNDASIGETVTFKTTITVRKGAEKYVLTDVTGAGLDYQTGSAQVYLVQKNASKEDDTEDKWTPLKSEDSQTVTIVNPDTTDSNVVSMSGATAAFYSLTGETARGFTISFTPEFLNFLNNRIGKTINDYKLVVSYNARLNENAAIDSTTDAKNKNTATLTYGDGSTITSATQTATWSMDVFKYTTSNVANATKVTGAQFEIRKTPTGEALQFIKNGDGTGNYTYVSDANYATNIAGATRAKLDDIKSYTVDGKTYVQTLTTDDNGILLAKGLDGGTYYLVETLAPAGYNTLLGPVKFHIVSVQDAANEDYYTKGAGGTYSEAQTTAGAVIYNDINSTPASEKNYDNLGSVISARNAQIDVLNTTSSELPSTGGMGTTVLYIVGGMLVILAGAYLFFSRKKTA